MANVQTWAKGLDFRTGGATPCQKSTGGMPPVPPALTEALGVFNKFKPAECIMCTYVTFMYVNSKTPPHLDG